MLLEGVAEAHRRRLRDGQKLQDLDVVGPWGNGEIGASVQSLVRAKSVWAAADWALLALLVGGVGWLLLPLLLSLQLHDDRGLRFSQP